jgi:hypothetical protein
MTREQMPKEDTLEVRGVDDLLDEGYSPPDRQPATHRIGTTGAELHTGDTLDQRLEQELPEADTYAEAHRPEGPWDEGLFEDTRAGRLVAPDQGAHEDTEGELIGEDVGIAGGAASAEEAAMRVIDETVYE